MAPNTFVLDLRQLLRAQAHRQRCGLRGHSRPRRGVLPRPLGPRSTFVTPTVPAHWPYYHIYGVGLTGLSRSLRWGESGDAVMAPLVQQEWQAEPRGQHGT